MELINKKDNQMIFIAEIEESLANAIRRYINQIPVLAVDEMEISRNDSPLYDETIAHRIGLIPIKTDKSVNGKKILKLDVKEEGIVYSGELKGDLKIVYERIPITTLNKGQELNISATVKKGKGEDHAKFSPGLMFYRNVVKIKLDKDCPKEVVNICPKKVFDFKEDNVVVRDSLECDMCEACIEICRKYEKDSIKLIPTKELVISLESFGQIDIKEIFKKSVEFLKKDLAEISKKIGK